MQKFDLLDKITLKYHPGAFTIVGVITPNPDLKERTYLISIPLKISDSFIYTLKMRDGWQAGQWFDYTTLIEPMMIEGQYYMWVSEGKVKDGVLTPEQLIVKQIRQEIGL